MGVFDTGVRADHPHFRAVKDRSNWTHEDTLKDGLGHGTFVAGVVASQDPACPGFAPDAEIHTFRVFTNDQVSYTSWFLDAFNYAIASEVHVINLSIGGPDYLDYPFVDKIDEIVANGIVMISAIGNDGPLWGTLNNPADQLDVIGVGGIDFKDQIAPFSSRGMSTHELPHGYGRVKPDVVAYGRDVMGSKIQGGCRSLSGTSVASPVVAGAVTLLASTVPIEKRWDILNPASMKQALVEGATRLEGSGDRSMYAQGAGKLNLVNAFEILRDYTPRASLVPGSLDFENEASCPYAWPHCTQPLYHGAMPFIFNATIVNGMGLGGWLAEPPRFEPKANGDENDLGAHLDFRFDFSETLFPWSGFLAMYVRVKASGAAERGIASGVVVFTVESPPGRGESATRSSRVEVPVRFSVAPTPPRAKRVLWSQFHSVRYPPGYIPRDSLDVKADILDWHGDHPHTNFHGAYDAMRAAGYFVEILGSPLTCFDARSYGALLLVDSEEEFSESEIAKLERDVREEGLGLAVFAEWYNVKQMESMRFFDDNTHSHWTPVVGGGNVPALNDALRAFGVQLGDRLLKGTAMLKSGEPIVYATGADIAAAPRNAHLHVAHLADHAANEPGAYGTAASPDGKAGKSVSRTKKKPANAEFAVAAFLDETALSGPDPEPPNGGGSDSGGSTKRDTGRVAVFGDSNCLDASHSASECFPFLIRTLRFLTEKDDETGLTPRDGSRRASTPYAPYGDDWRPPVRRPDVDFDALSTTRGGHPGNEGRRGMCGANDPLEFQDAQLREKTSYAAAGWSRARAERTAETRPKNWRERIGAEAAAELVALGDVFAERRRETAGVAARGSSSSSSFPENGLEGNDGDARDIDAFAKEQVARGAANGARGFPSDELERDARNRRRAGDSSGFASERSVVSGFASSGGERPSLSSVRFPTTLTTERAGLAAACLFVCVAAARLRERRRPKRVAKKSAGAASKTSTPAKRGRRLAP
jgi:membrane-bound transcription factor site-1 protease